eukprot:CAMPEP_0202510266 /NCGR_PEP_ID=MMETSP1361-20130828/53204_1 /ASSEMBLY_ACC=CAM_ASM_000849 /TAXON_ID=210615 /ORGANISM="Staurosira complex sp., Strain CCMP2646" /LENGTH=647 /DNA_ID=CAMNT_0049144525 /DNA_START=92 /DNA_END=2034 /DNA_ORIENTATION=+
MASMGCFRAFNLSSFLPKPPSINPALHASTLSSRLCTREEVRHGFWKAVTLKEPPYIPLEQMENSECYGTPYNHETAFPKGALFETWEWTPWNTTTGDCDLTKWNKERFCSVMQDHYSNADDKSTVVIVGDSLSMEHYNSFLELLGLKFILQKWNSKVSFVRYACDDQVKLVYRGDGRFVRMPTILATDKPNVLIANRGAHYTNDNEFEKETKQVIPHLLTWQAECGSSCAFVYRTTVPGHPKCQEFDLPTTDTLGMEERIANASLYDEGLLEKWHWPDYKRQNELAQRLFTEASIDYKIIDGYDINILRPDEHRGGKTNSDCLHGCFPGKVDTYSALLLHILLEKVEERSHDATQTRTETTKVSMTGSARNAAARLSSRDVLARGPKYNDFWLLISRRLRLAVTIVPKVMCSSIRTALNRLECGTNNNTALCSVTIVPKVMCSSIRTALNRLECGTNNNTRCAEVRKNRTLATEDVRKMTRVAFVRDPFERALSAYENSYRNRFIHINRCHNMIVCTFSEWVSELGKNATSTFENEHFLPQVNILQLDQMRYDYIFRLSSPGDQHFFWSILCERHDSIKVNIAHHDTNETAMFKGLEHLTPETFEILAKLYAKDLVLWKKVLHYGTLRDPNELTLYDYYNRKAKVK